MQRLIQRLRHGLGYSRRRRSLPRWMRKSLLALTLLAMVAGYFATVAQASRSGWVDAQLQTFGEWTDRQIADAGFRIASVTAYGNTKTEAAALRAALGVSPGAATLTLDLGQLRQRVEALPWVHVASVERALPDRLIVRVLEREPVALLQNGGQLSLLDSTGATIPYAHLADFVDLPAVTGKGAAAAAPALLQMLASDAGMSARVTSATLLGERRWDVRIDDRVWVRLPEQKPIDAWLRLADLENEHAMLRRNVLTADVRNPRQWVFRLPPGSRLRMAIENSGS